MPLQRTIFGGKLTLSELISEGNVGLIRAIEKFDTTINVRFSTYAQYWVKHQIRLAIRRQDRKSRMESVRDMTSDSLSDYTDGSTISDDIQFDFRSHVRRGF